MVDITIRPADPGSWPDLRSLIGAVGGCWCMFFRQTPQQRRAEWGEGNRSRLEELVATGAEPGLIAYRDGVPVGWCSIGPREQFSRLDRSPISKRVDEESVWSLVCLFVDRAYRGTGVARALVRGALAHAGARGASQVEAYPVDDTIGEVPAGAAYHGLVSLLRSAGFTEVARRTPTRPVMRCAVAGGDD